MQTLHGLHVHGFPNLFVVGPAGGNLISNITHNLPPRPPPHRPGCGSAHSSSCPEVEVSDEAEQAWVELLEEADRRCWPTPTAHRLLQQRGPTWAAVSD